MRTADRGGMEGGAGQVALAQSRLTPAAALPPTALALCCAALDTWPPLAALHATDIVNSPQWLCVVTSWTVFSVLSLCADFFFVLFYKGVWNCEYSPPSSLARVSHVW